MSLKAIHIIFVVVSVLLAFSFGGYELNEYSGTHVRADLLMGAGSLLGGLLLLVYGKYVLRKLKHISYL